MRKKDAGIPCLGQHKDLANCSRSWVGDRGESSDGTDRVGIQSLSVAIIATNQTAGFRVLVSIIDELAVETYVGG